jgi:predicted helicase
VLDQFKEKKPKDLTIREHFNTYHFASHKAGIIELLGKVAALSAETAGIVAQMKKAAKN